MKWYCNWPVHNIIGHPMMQILMWVGLVYPPAMRWAIQFHDRTCPEET